MGITLHCILMTIPEQQCTTSNSNQQVKAEVGSAFQVLKKHLGMHLPTISCGSFMYEEGEDLDEEEVKAHALNMPKALQCLPGIHLSYIVVGTRCNTALPGHNS